MASRKQAETKKQDSLLDHLDEIDDELDEMERDARKRKRKEAKEQKKNAGRTIVLVIAAVIAGMLGHTLIFPSSKAEKSSEETTEERTDPDSGMSQAEEISDADAKEYIDAFRNDKILLDGDAYPLNLKLKDFINNGWQYAADGGLDHLEAGDSEHATLIRNGKKIDSVYLSNPGKKTVPLSEALVQNVYLQGSGIDVEMPADLEIGADEAQTKQCFIDSGLPYKVENNEWNTTYSARISYNLSSPDYEYGSLYLYASVEKDSGTTDYCSFTLYGSDAEYISFTISQ